MLDLLNNLYEQLKTVFEEKLPLKEKKYDSENRLDALSTFMTLKKHEKDFKLLVEKASFPKETLIYEFSKEVVAEAISLKYIREGAGLSSNNYFIASNGLFHLYQINGLDLYAVFSNYDNFKFPEKKLKLKVQEKIWCIFLILFDATSRGKMLDTSSINIETLDKYFNFLMTIEKEMELNQISIGKKIGWGKGKEINFRKFITNTVDLPKTGLYHYPSSKYWIDIENRKNVLFLLDLILDEYSAAERVLANELFYNALWTLSNKMLSELNELPRTLNSILSEELKG